MRRLVVLTLAFGLMGGLLGCGETTKVEKKTTVSTPQGSTTTTTTQEVEKEGSNPPAAKP